MPCLILYSIWILCQYKLACCTLTDTPQFIQHSRAISLYRTIVRGVTSLDPDMRRETLSFVRAEFERNKHVTDLVSISLLSPFLDLFFFFTSPCPLSSSQYQALAAQLVHLAMVVLFLCRPWFASAACLFFFSLSGSHA